MFHNMKNRDYCVQVIPWITQVLITSLSTSAECGNQDYVSEIYCWKEINPCRFQQPICLTQ